MMEITNIPPAFIYLAGALLMLVLPRKVRPAAFLVFPVLAFILLLNMSEGTHWVVTFLNYDLVLSRADYLTRAFGYVFVVMSLFGGVYGFHVREKLHQVSSLLYMGSSLGVVFAGDLVTLLIFWEMMAASSVFLIWGRGTPDSRKAGFRYIMVHAFGGGVLMAGILVYYAQTGSMAFEHFSGGLASYLILIGFAINAAIPPLHAWLPDAYPQGTVVGSVFLSGFTTKVAIYALARGFAGMDILIWAGVVMALYGVVFAVLENDIRRLLAYHIVSQVGYMVCAVGIGTEMAVNGAVAHAFAHILYKGLLFMGAGTVLHTTGRSKLTELGGLARFMPLTLGLYMVGAFSISGFPLFSGFVSKSMVIYAAELDHLGIVAALLNLASVGTFLHTGLKLPYFTWFSEDRGLKPGPTPLGMYLGMAMTAIACIAIGVYPTLLYNLLPFPVDYHPYTATHVIQTMELLVFTGLGFWLLINMLHGQATITLDTDWFYRRPARLAYNVFSVSVTWFYHAVDQVAMQLVRGLVRWGANPPGFLVQAVVNAGYSLTGSSKRDREPESFTPERYRIPLGIMVLVVLAALVVILLWNAFT